MKKLRFVVFLCGAAVMIIELTGSRIIAPFYGNSLFVWGSLIGIILAALSLGYYFGGRLADSRPDLKALALIILLSGVVVSLIPLLSDMVLQPSALLFGMVYGPLFSVTVLFALPGFLLGMVSPYAVKLETEKLEHLGNTAGNIYAISTLGSIIGTLLTAFVLIPVLGTGFIIFSTGLLLIFTSLITSSGRGLKALLASSMVVYFFLLLVFLSNSSAESDDYVVVYRAQTPYHQIVVKDWVNSSIRTMELDASKTGGFYLNSSKALYPYTDFFHLALVLNPNASRVLFIGCGAGTGPKRFRSLYPGVEVDVVDIDPAVNDAAIDYFNVKVDDRLRLYTQDARVYLANSEIRYDIIIVDVFNSVRSIPFHLMTEEFVYELYQHLTDDGVVVLNLIASLENDTSSIYRAQYRTYDGVYPALYVFPVLEDYSGVQNIMLFASKSDFFYSKMDFLKKADILFDKIRIPDLIKYAGNYLEDDVSTLDVPVLTDDYAPVEYLLSPIVNSYYEPRQVYSPKVCFEGVEHCVDVEVSDKQTEHMLGLMYRRELDNDEGMLFVFPDEGIWSFWMKNTKIPLDILWLDEDGNVVHIEKNALPCKNEPCRVYRPEAKAVYVLEVAANYTLVNQINLNSSCKLIL